MEIDYLRNFVDIAHLGNLTKAAELNNISQPAMSRILSVVENYAGTNLFDRVGRSLQLNQRGKIFLDAVIESLSILDNAKSKICDQSKNLIGDLNIAVISIHHIIPILITKFAAIHPDVRISTFPISDENELNASNCDLCFLTEPNRNSDQESKRLFDENLLAVVTKQHKLAEKTSIDLRELSDDLFVTTPRWRTKESLVDLCNQAGFTPKIGLEIDNLNMQKSFIMLRQAVTLWPESATSAEDRDLKFIPIAEPYCARTFVVSWWKNRRITPVMEALIEFAATHCGKSEKENIGENR